MPSTERMAPKTSGIRDPRDVKKWNGMFSNWPRFLKIGGARGTGHLLDQAGDKDPKLKPAESIGHSTGTKSSVGPISDRGK